MAGTSKFEIVRHSLDNIDCSFHFFSGPPGPVFFYTFATDTCIMYPNLINSVANKTSNQNEKPCPIANRVLYCSFYSYN